MLKLEHIHAPEINTEDTARLNARLFTLENSDGKSVLTGHIIYNFSSNIFGRKVVQKVGTDAKSNISSNFFGKKTGRKSDGSI